MSTAEIRSAILAKLEAVEDIGNVHNRQRYTQRQNDFKEMYMEDTKLIGWHVSRVSTRETKFDDHFNKAIHRWQIRGYMGLEDEEETELVFDKLIETIRDIFRKDETLNGIVETIFTDGGAGLQLDDFGPVTFAGVLCHGAKLSLATEVFVEIDPYVEADLADFKTGHVDIDLAAPDDNPETSDTFTLETTDDA